MKPFLLLVFLLVSSASNAGELDDRLEELGFFLSTPPSDYSKPMRTFGVSLEDGKLVVIESERGKNGLQKTIKIGGNRFDAVDQGEWGGSLLVTRADGSKNSLTQENTKGFLQYAGKLYALTGLAHMGIDTGALYRIDSPDSVPRLSVVTLLPGATMGTTQDDAHIYVVTSGDLVAVALDENGPWGPALEVIALRDIWNGFYPTSLVKKGNQFAIGMRFGVVVVDWEPMRQKSSIRFYSK
jgi:hypothetical protein